MNRHSWLFRLACRLLKYFLLAVFGFALTCVLLSTFVASSIAVFLLTTFGELFLRLAVLVVSILTTAIVCESLRQ